MIHHLALQRAAVRVRKYAQNTSVLTNTFLNQELNAEVFLKAEQQQPIGAFKIRGAANFALQLSLEKIKKGLVTHSSGNHAQAVAYVAKQLNTRAWVVMPENANKVKVQNARRWGAEVLFCQPTLESRTQTANQIVQTKGATLIPPFDHEWIIEGQSTCAQELIAEVGSLDYLLTPLGGGGLLAGTALAARFLSPMTKVVGCEPEQAADGLQGFKSGIRVEHATAQTVADGLRTTVGALPFSIIKEDVHDIWVAGEEEIKAMTQRFWAETRSIIEPSSSVPLAVMMNHKEELKGKRIGAILTGGNVDFSVPL